MSEPNAIVDLNNKLKHINGDASVIVVHEISSSTTVAVTVDPVKDSESLNIRVTI